VIERPPPPIRIVIELSASRDPIEGAVIEPSKQAAPFRGWLALTSLIEAARNSREPAENTPE
jgi:hypothetical protein